MTMNRRSDPDAWRLGHDSNCNVRIAFPTSSNECNCGGPISEEEMGKLLSDLESMKAKWDEENALKPKPMRIRCMELPMEHEGDEVRTPFIIIIDRAPALASLSLSDRDQIAGAIKAQTGARGVLVFTQEIQVDDD